MNRFDFWKKKMMSLSLCLVLAGSMLAGCGDAAAGEESGTAAVKENAENAGSVFEKTENDVTVTLTTDKKNYEAGEQVKFTLTLDNQREDWNIAGRKFYYTLPEEIGIADGTDFPTRLPIIKSGENTVLEGVLTGGGEAPEKAPTTVEPTVNNSEIFTLRPYVFITYGGQEMQIRMILNIEMVEIVKQVAIADRKPAKTVSCHDPSIFKDFDGTYYVVGTHITSASSTDLFDWKSRDDVFKKSLSEETIAQIRAYNKDDTSGSWNGYLWAPDIIYNTAMQKYCIYLSANGDDWVSNIVLLTGDSVDGPFEYAGTVVYGGFTQENLAQTDVPRVLGTDTIPERYVTNGVANHKWGDEYPNCIDPCVFYDEEGKLWFTYGSWSGGIFMLELDEETGLRDYGVSYETNRHSDAYFGTKIAGGKYVSGEGSYVQHIGDYYYLFISYGGLSAKEGYNIRIYRSENPDGPYVDAKGNSALFDSWVQNFNLSNGVRLFGAYKWKTMSVGEVAQGHNSAFVDDDGKAYIVFHTRTTNGTEGHYVKVHQLFVNKNGWLVAAPFKTDGETLKEDGYEASEVAGSYDVILHEINVDYEHLGVSKPVTVELNADGSISGAMEGSWSLESGTPYIDLTIGGETYSGVTLRMNMENTSVETMTFTALGETNQLTIWGAKVVE